MATSGNSGASYWRRTAAMFVAALGMVATWAFWAAPPVSAFSKVLLVTLLISAWIALAARMPSPARLVAGVLLVALPVVSLLLAELRDSQALAARHRQTEKLHQLAIALQAQQRQIAQPQTKLGARSGPAKRVESPGDERD